MCPFVCALQRETVACMHACTQCSMLACGARCVMSMLCSSVVSVGLQTVQYIQPQHHERLGQAELLVIDEAAAIPLPLVKAMLGPYLVFLCSTVNG